MAARPAFASSTRPRAWAPLAALAAGAAIPAVRPLVHAALDVPLVCAYACRAAA